MGLLSTSRILREIISYTANTVTHVLYSSFFDLGMPWYSRYGKPDCNVPHTTDAWLKTREDLTQDYFYMDSYVDEERLRGRIIYPKNKKPDFLMLYLHGFSLSSKLSGWFFDSLYKKHNLAILAPDLRSHGWSDESKYKLDSSWLVKDCEDYITYLKKRWPNKPIYIAGESVGGVLAAQFAVDLGYAEINDHRKPDKDIKGYIFFSPCFEVRIPSILRDIGLLASSLAPSLPIPFVFDPMQLVAPSIVSGETLFDPTYKTFLTGKMLYKMLATKEIKPLLKFINRPFIVFQGTHDIILNGATTIELLADECVNAERVLYLVDGGKHGLVHDILERRETIFEKTNEWISQMNKRKSLSPVSNRVAKIEKMRAFHSDTSLKMH